MQSQLLLCGLLLCSTVALEIAVTSSLPRCMIVYTTNEDDFLKIDIKFPKIHSVDAKNYYIIELKNTETEDVEKWTIEMGTLRKEIQLSESTNETM
jgi:hypothetical protein